MAFDSPCIRVQHQQTIEKLGAGILLALKSGLGAVQETSAGQQQWVEKGPAG